MALTVVDASVFIALLDAGDAHHADAHAAIASHVDDDLRIPAHTLAEALVHPARLGREREARRQIAALEIAVDPVDEQTAIAAARLRARHGGALCLPDALVLAYADVRKAASILTADAGWTRWSRRVSVVGA